MSPSGVSFNIEPPTGPQATGKMPGDEGKRIEAMVFAALLAMMGVNAGLIRNKYMKAVEKAEKWVEAGNGIQGPINGDPGNITNKQWDAFGNGWEFFQKQVKEWDAYVKEYEKTHHGQAPKTPPLIEEMKDVLNNKGLQQLFGDLTALQKAENQHPPDKAKIKQLKALLKKNLTDFQNPTTPAGKAVFDELNRQLNAYGEATSGVVTILGKQAMLLVNNLKSLGAFTSNMLKRFQGISEFINSAIPR